MPASKGRIPSWYPLKQLDESFSISNVSVFFCLSSDCPSPQNRRYFLRFSGEQRQAPDARNVKHLTLDGGGREVHLCPRISNILK